MGQNHRTAATTDPPSTALARLGRWCFDHRARAVGLWVAALVVIFTAVGAVGPAYEDAFDVPGSGSTAGYQVMEEHFPQLGTGGESGTIVFRADQGVADPEVRGAMEGLFDLVGAGFPDADGVPQHPGATVVSPYDADGAGQVATDGPLAGQLAYAQVNLAPDVDLTEASAIGAAIAGQAPAIEGLEVLPGGAALGEFVVPESELIGLAFAVVILVLAFGSVLAMGLPLAVAVAGVGAGVGLTGLISSLMTVPDYSTMVAIMIGLGVGIDYALFIVVRYREALHDGRAPRDATAIAMDTAGRSVLFAGMTVVLSLLGMLLIGLASISGLAVGASVTVLVTMVSSLTLLPALLGLAGHRVELSRWRGVIAAGSAAVALLGTGLGVPAVAAGGALATVVTLSASLVLPGLRRPVPRRAAKAVEDTVAYRWSRTIQRHPARWLVAGTTVLLVLASPILGMRLGFADEGNSPEETSTRQAYDLLAEGFGPGFNGPLVLAVDLDGADPSSLERLGSAVAATPGVAMSSPPVLDDPSAPRAALLTVIPETAPQDEATSDLVHDLRDRVIPTATAGTGIQVHVTGSAAADVDFTEYLGGRIPVFFGAVLGLSFLLLMIVFRSVLVPLKAVVMNGLSLAAAFGAVVVVFQWGWGAGLFGISGAPIDAPLPMILFAIVFGVSMDYEVFLLSRVREEYLRSGDAARSVADGLASTARVITAAAAIMIVVFGSFVLEADRGAKLFGFSLALAVFLDATLIRMLLVPATMELLGSRNWWMPRWLDRLLPHVAVEGGHGTSTDVHADDPAVIGTVPQPAGV